MADDTKPDVTIPDGDAPAELTLEDLEVGSGDEATAGSTVEVHYVGVAWSDGQQFDASWDRGDTFDFHGFYRELVANLGADVRSKEPKTEAPEEASK